MNEQEESKTSTGGRPETEMDNRSASARQIFTATYRDVNGYLSGALMLTVEVEDSKVVKMRVRDSNGQPYEVVFQPVKTPAAESFDKFDEDKKDDKKDKDDKDECVKCDATGCKPVKCSA